ncbi:MAG: hypothetical protein VX590_00460 [Chloroflexota bacterium]|nr:hypothetical protein [Chloroflexota bacterium]
MKKTNTNKIKKSIGYFRKFSRNPSNLQIFFVSIFIAIIFSLTLGPIIYERGKTGLDEVFRVKNSREFGGDIDVEAWVYSWIRTGTINMINAQGPSQWRAVSWDEGCYSRRFTEWNRKYQESIQKACYDLSEIQKKYEGYCMSVNNCLLPKEAVNELNNVLSDMKYAFSDANFVLPYRQNEENSID